MCRSKKHKHTPYKNSHKYSWNGKLVDEHVIRNNEQMFIGMSSHIFPCFKWAIQLVVFKENTYHIMHAGELYTFKNNTKRSFSSTKM